MDVKEVVKFILALAIYYRIFIQSFIKKIDYGLFTQFKNIEFCFIRFQDGLVNGGVASIK